MGTTKPKSLKKLIARAIKKADRSYVFEDYGKQADAVIAMLRAEGIALVPMKPNDAMVDAGVQAIGTGKIRPEDHVRFVYTDMIKEGAKQKSVL